MTVQYRLVKTELRPRVEGGGVNTSLAARSSLPRRSYRYGDSPQWARDAIRRVSRNDKP